MSGTSKRSDILSLLLFLYLHAFGLRIRVWSGTSWFGLLTDGVWAVPNYLGTVVNNREVPCDFVREGEGELVLFEAQPLMWSKPVIEFS